MYLLFLVSLLAEILAETGHFCAAHGVFFCGEVFLLLCFCEKVSYAGQIFVTLLPFDSAKRLPSVSSSATNARCLRVILLRSGV